MPTQSIVSWLRVHALTGLLRFSGGQKACLSLARAAFTRADIVLLRHPLSTVDPRVGSMLFQERIGPQGIAGALSFPAGYHVLPYSCLCITLQLARTKLVLLYVARVCCVAIAGVVPWTATEAGLVNVQFLLSMSSMLMVSMLPTLPWLPKIVHVNLYNLTMAANMNIPHPPLEYYFRSCSSCLTPSTTVPMPSARPYYAYLKSCIPNQDLAPPPFAHGVCV